MRGVKKMLMGLAALAVGLVWAMEKPSANPLPTGPEVWLELMGGNVRLDGLTKDLEAIKAAGISGVHLFHIYRPNGRMHPGSKEPMPCMGSKWEAMVRHVGDECRRLGLKLVLQNCPGWSQSGGPWIPPERAMRDLTFVRRDLKGGETLAELPPVPSKFADADSDWRDICVLAFPTPEGDETGDLKPASKEGTGDEIVYRFEHPVVVRTMSLPRLHHWNTAYGYHAPWRHVTLEAKTAAGWTTVLDSPIPTTNWRDYVHDISFACDEAKSDTWRYRIRHDFPFKQTFEPTFSAAARLTDWQAKAGRTLRSLLFEQPAKQGPSAWIDPMKIVDLTGRTDWTAPAGRWTVLRFGHVNAKYVNAPAPKEATGWECDKLDPAGIETHFAGYVGKLADGVLANRLHGMVVDSWECWCQTWTAKMEDYYRAANGEELRANLPALFGWIVGSPERTEAFLTRWRRTVGDLVTKNYYGRMAELARAKNLACYYETAFGDIIYGDLLEYWKYADAPMCEFWYPHVSVDEGGCACYDYKPIRPCASAAHIYGKRRVSAEAFTGNGIRWDEDFARMQDDANRHFARGVTHLVFHCCTHQPDPQATPPGNCMEGYNGTPFSRLQTWWKDMPEFTGFLTRCEKLLEEGLPSQDVLWYLGDAVDHKPPELFPFPEGFRADYLNHDVLTNRLTVRDGVFAIPEGTTWKVLWVPETRFMLPATKSALDRLAAAGGKVVYGDKTALVQALAGFQKDVATEPALGDEPSEDFMWIHRKVERGERYFVAAGTNGYSGRVTFRAKGPVTVYDPVTCTRRDWTNGSILELPPSRSVFVDFCPSAQPTTTEAKTVPGTEKTCALRDFTLRFAPGWGAPEEVKLAAPVSWTEIPGFSREAKAYSGTVVYETAFDIDVTANGRLPVTTLDLGRVASQAKVLVNGRCVGLLWCAPYRIDLTPYVARGRNRLRLEVTNTWRNRVIYDLGQTEEVRKTWIVNQPGYNPTADDPLEPAGVLGPVTLTTAERTNDPYDYKDLVVRDVPCARAVTNAANHLVVDFGRDAIGWLEVGGAAGSFEIVIGEMTNAEGRVANPHPGSTIRVQMLKGEKPEGWFRPAMKPDKWNLTGYNPKVSPAILLPDRLGLVFPFRYAEIVRLPSATDPRLLVQKAVNYPIDMGRSAFDCSDPDLVRVHDLCKYSVLATSFTGIYVDGDRERTPYEADGYINQMAHYAIDDDCSMARRSFEWLMDHPTWPTEWKQHMVKMAWADWMWTGDTRSIARFYDRLRDVKLMRGFARPTDGLLETGGEMKKGAKPGAADIVDWPEPERDGFEFRPVNAVVNAFFVRNLEEMRDMAAALGRDDEARAFAADAIRLHAAYQKAFFDPQRGLYVDGEGATHVSVQANAAALAFGLVPPERIGGVADWLVSRGMGCSTYFAQYLLEALFAAGRDEAAIALMTAKGDRGWLGMMDFGSTITTESWNMRVKPNQDLNHGWSTSPLSMISRFVLGVTPLEPGFAKVSVRPQVGKLKSVSGTVPTAKGPVKVDVRGDVLRVETPVPARVVWKGRTHEMPAGTRDFFGEAPYRVCLDGVEVNAEPVRLSAMPFNRVWAGSQRPLDQTREGRFVDVEVAGSAKLTVAFKGPMPPVTAYPMSETSGVSVTDKTLTLSVGKRGYRVLDFGEDVPPLHVFVNSPRTSRPKPGDIYFGPGVHEAGLIAPASGQTVFIDRGAVVHGELFIDRATNVTVTGGGILDASGFARWDARARAFRRSRGLPEEDTEFACHSCVVYASEGVSISDIVIRDTPFWSLIVRNGSKNVTIDGVKVIGQWRYNSDGIDIAASENVTVRNCFMRTFDDCAVVLDGYLDPTARWSRHVTFENCFLWCDWDDCIKVWAGAKEGGIEHVRFSNCILAHVDARGCSVNGHYSSPSTLVRDVVFEDLEYDVALPRLRGRCQSAELPAYPKGQFYESLELFDMDIRIPSKNLGNQQWRPLTDAEQEFCSKRYRDIAFRRLRVFGAKQPLTARISVAGKNQSVRNVAFEDVPDFKLTTRGDVVLDPPETEGWENTNPDRKEFPPSRVVWTAPAGGYKVEKEDGAEGSVTVSNGVVTIRKTNDRGRIVVSAPPFKAEKGRMLRFFADVEAFVAKPQDALGYVCVWSDARRISPEDPLSPYGGFECGGQTMRLLVNSAPQTTYRKFMHHTPVAEDVTAAIVVSGAASTSVWKNLAADDHEAAQATWAEHFKRLHAPDRRGDLQDEAEFDRSVASDVDHTAKIETRDGYSRFVVDGEVRAPIVYKSCEWNFDGRVTYAGKPLQNAGVRIGVVNLRLGDLKLPSFSGPWTEHGFDVKAAVQTVKDEMRVADKSLFILAMGTSAYPEFTEKEHPDEVWIRKDGAVAHGNSGSVIPDSYNDGGKPDPGDRRWPWVSPASPSWRAAIKRVTAELFEELKRTGLMKRIIGVHYFGYHDGQFAMPILDYSPCAKAEYARYLKENGISETDPAGSFEYFSKQLGFRALEDFSREAKRIAGKPIIACKWEMSPFNISFDVTSFLRSDAVDVIVPQANYHRRFPALAQGLNVPTASFHRHGKMLWLEFDFRTWAALDQWESSVPFTKGVNAAEDIVMWRTLIRKNAGMMNACRMGWWLYDMGGGWYYPPEIVEDFKGVWNIRQELDRAKPDPWHPDVAFVVDELAMANYNTPHGPKVKDPVTMATLQWPRNAEAGVPYETFLADDFYSDPELARRYRAVFLAGFVEPSPRQKELMSRIEAAGVRIHVVQPGGLTPRSFHDFAKNAGAFVAADPDVLEVDMNGDFLSVHCLVPGTHVVRLPFRAEVVNLKTGARETADRLVLPLTAGETRWYRLRREFPIRGREAEFISPAKTNADCRVAVFERSVTNRRSLTRATMDITAQGVCRVWLNGREVGDEDFLKPGYTSVEKCRHVYRYDVLPFLDGAAQATNVISASVAPTWWCDSLYARVPNQEYPWKLGERVAFWCVLRLRYDDGSEETVGTDTSWLAAYSGPVRDADLYHGEVVDARATAGALEPSVVNREFDGEFRPVAAKVALRKDLALRPVSAVVLKGVEGASEDAFGTARVVRRYADGERMSLDCGETLVLDFGQNASAVPSFVVTGASGVQIRLRHAEMLNEANGERKRGNDGPSGTPYLSSLRSARAEVLYTLRDGIQAYRPCNTFFGYRYVGVTSSGPVTFGDFRSIPVSSVTKEMERGSIITGDERVNRLISNIRWSLLSNYLSVPTDCPQRDERLGWTADTQVFMNGAAYLTDTYDFLRKYLQDLRDGQYDDGLYTCFVPNVRHVFRRWASCGWTDAGVIIPYRLWKWYGQREVIDESWSSMERYMQFLRINEKPYRINNADWLAYEHRNPASSKSGIGQTLPYCEMMNAYFHFWMADLMQKMAAVTGRDERAQVYADEAKKLKEAFTAAYVGSDGVVRDEWKGQCTDLYMLKLGLCGDPKAVETTKCDLIANIRANGNRLQTGFLGTAILLPTLTFEAGAPDVAYDLLMQDENPSWLYSVDQGATTVWERWNSYTKEKGFGPAMMNSFNHYAYGCVIEWLFSAAAGIRPSSDANGWKRFTLHPYPDRRLGSVNAEYRSPVGLIKSEWRYEDKVWIWQFSIPTGSEAVITVPGEKVNSLYQAGSYKVVVENRTGEREEA